MARGPLTLALSPRGGERGLRVATVGASCAIDTTVAISASRGATRVASFVTSDVSGSGGGAPCASDRDGAILSMACANSRAVE